MKSLLINSFIQIKNNKNLYIKNLVLLTFLLIFNFFFAQKIELINPPNWWIGMKYSKIEILLKGNNIGNSTFELKNENEAQLLAITKVQNPNYIILNVDVSKVSKEKILEFNYSSNKQKNQTFKFELKEKKSGIGKKGLNSSDLIYLIFPDRFVNGNPENDFIGKMKDPLLPWHFVGRKGGDLEGVISKLDYIKNLGFTSIWLCPVEENNTKLRSYHGYGFTSHFEVDKRFGGNEMYQKYVEESHKKGLKTIKDVVFNHCNESYILWEDKIDDSWFNPKQLTNYRIPSLVDSYASDYDKNLTSNGWFVNEMPDFNQKNSHVAIFLIQYALWWIEKYDIDAYRIDTFGYSDNQFMWNMINTVKKEYPDFFIFGEIWDSQEAILSYFTKDKYSKENPNFIGITDFEMQYAFMDMANENFGWNTGLARTYYTLAQDYLYPKNGNYNVTFLGNHDIDRFLTSIKNDIDLFKLATTMLLTTRGIPQWYYADEILAINQKDPDLEGFKGDDALRRIPFPGGFKDDKNNKFTSLGRTETENNFFNFFTKLANYRKNSKAITEGKLIHFVPQDNVYVYFRVFEKQKIMVIINRNEKDFSLNLERFKELLPQNSSVKNILTDENLYLVKELKLNPKTSYIFEIKN